MAKTSFKEAIERKRASKAKGKGFSGRSGVGAQKTTKTEEGKKKSSQPNPAAIERRRERYKKGK